MPSFSVLSVASCQTGSWPLVLRLLSLFAANRLFVFRLPGVSGANLMHWFWRVLIAVGAGAFVVQFVHDPFCIQKVARPGQVFELCLLRWATSLVAATVSVAIYVALRKTAPHDTETRCRKCGYILRGIPEPRCPECGEHI